MALAPVVVVCWHLAALPVMWVTENEIVLLALNSISTKQSGERKAGLVSPESPGTYGAKRQDSGNGPTTLPHGHVALWPGAAHSQSDAHPGHRLLSIPRRVPGKTQIKAREKTIDRGISYLHENQLLEMHHHHHHRVCHVMDGGKMDKNEGKQLPNGTTGPSPSGRAYQPGCFMLEDSYFRRSISSTFIWLRLAVVSVSEDDVRLRAASICDVAVRWACKQNEKMR